MKQFETDAINLTHKCLCHYWQLDYQFVLDYCASDVIWIGSRQDEFILGFDETKADFEENIKDLQPCHLINAEFHAIASSSKLCAVTGRYLVTTDNNAAFFLQVQQRCSFVWEKTDNGLKIKHIHVSNPMGELKLAENETFPTTIGKMAHQYMLNHLKRTKDNTTLIANGDGGSLHFLQLSEILYVSALGKDAVVNTVQGKIFVKSSITNLATQAPNSLVSIHRSYLVNPAYVSSIERYSVTITNGDKLPVPAKRFNELRETLLNIHKTITE